jgi:hypothetical protein
VAALQQKARLAHHVPALFGPGQAVDQDDERSAGTRNRWLVELGKQRIAVLQAKG